MDFYNLLYFVQSNEKDIFSRKILVDIEKRKIHINSVFYSFVFKEFFYVDYCNCCVIMVTSALSYLQRF